jgi:hypothetical protein
VLPGPTVARLLILPLLCGLAAATPAAEVPTSPFIGIVYRYADTMLASGRDTVGPQKTGLFLSALDRERLQPLAVRPAPPAGIRRGDRVGEPWEPLVGANPHHDENLLRVLYTLSDLSAKPVYREAADAELKWFLENAASPSTHLLPWGEHMSWNVVTDAAMPRNEDGVHEFYRPWVLWDRCFDLAPDASARFATALWERQIANHETGAFDRHAGYWKPMATDGMDFPRHAGFYLRTWGAAYARTKNPLYTQAIDVLLKRYEGKRHAETGLIEERSGRKEAATALTLSLAIDCEAAAAQVPDPLALRLRAFAAREDAVFCGLPHDLAGRRGFLARLDKATRAPLEFTPTWDAAYGRGTTGTLAMMCVARYETTGSPEYRRLILGAADAYLEATPDAEADAWPMTYGHAISLELAAWRETARQAYFDRARELGTQAVARFWQDRPLPRASVKCGHYEAITGADTLALALLDLHLNILHITAVKCPPNTIDR